MKFYCEVKLGYNDGAVFVSTTLKQVSNYFGINISVLMIELVWGSRKRMFQYRTN